MPTANDTPQDPQNVLLEFIASMNAWEKACSDRRSKWKEQNRATGVQGDYAEILATNSRELEQIFQQYCAPNQSRTHAVVWRRPPEYNPDTEKIIEVAKQGAKCRIRTQYTGDPRPKVHEYVLTNSDGQWRLQSKNLVLGDKLEPLIL
jgi:hypothetical protein